MPEFIRVHHPFRIKKFIINFFCRVVPPPKPVFEPAHLCPKCGQRFTLQSVLSRHLCSAKTGTNSGPEFESDFTVQPDVTLNGHVRNENINADISG